MHWDTKRKLVYALATIVALTAFGVFLLRNMLFPEPTCFDNKKNGFELDVDCGGTCSLRCTQEVDPLTVIWAKAVQTEQNQYDLVGMIKNNNIDNASHELGYTFTAYDKDGNILKSWDGSTTPPLDGSFPIIMQDIAISPSPAQVSLSITDGKHYKVIESPSSPTVRILDRRYEPGSIPHVYAIIKNTKQKEINKLPVRAVLFDENDNAYAVGETLIPLLGKEATQEVSFTWREPFTKSPTRIGIYPIFNPFDASSY